MYCLQNGADRFKGEIFAATLKDPRYFPLFEPPLGPYLARLIDLLSEPEPILVAVKESLLSSRRGHTQDHLLGIVTAYAEKGDADMAEAIRSVARRNLRNGDSSGVQEWARIDGASAFFETITLVGKHLKKLIRTKKLGMVAYELEDGLGEEAFGRLMTDSRSRSLVAERLWQEINPNTSVPYQKPIGPTKFSEILPLGPNWNRNKWKLRFFARHASASEFLKAAKHLPSEERERAAYVELLFTIPKRAFPGDPEPLIRDANSRFRDLRLSALKALGQVKGDSVRAFALSAIKRKGLTGVMAADILAANYHPGDEGILLDRAQTCSNDWQRHHIGFALLDVVRATDEESQDLALWAYYHDPCSQCRYTAVSLMNERMWLSDEMKEECRFDVEEETQALGANAEDDRRQTTDAVGPE